MNVEDNILKAYQAQYPNLAEEHSLHEHWLEMMDRGEGSMTGFISGVKGKVAEFSAADQLRDAGWTGVEIAPNPTQPIFDIRATPPGGGAEVQWQMKTGGAERANEVADAMAEAPDVQFAVSSEIYERIADSTPEAVDRLMDMGADWELVDGIRDGLGTLAGNPGDRRTRHSRKYSPLRRSRCGRRPADLRLHQNREGSSGRPTGPPGTRSRLCRP